MTITKKLQTERNLCIMQKKLSKRLLSIFTAVLMIAGIIAGTISVEACEYCWNTKNEYITSGNSYALYTHPSDFLDGLTSEYIYANDLCITKCAMDYIRNTTWNIGKDDPTAVTAKFIPDDPDDILSEGTLLVEGTGATKDFLNVNGDIDEIPWRNAVKFIINKIVVGDGITTIGTGIFRDTKQLKEVVLPDKLTTINEGAFHDCENLINVNIPDSLKKVGYLAFGGVSEDLYWAIVEKFPEMLNAEPTPTDSTVNDNTTEATQNSTVAPSVKPVTNNTAVVNTYTAVKTDVKSINTTKITSVKVKNVADNKISVKWNKINDAKKYKVQISKTKKFKKLIINKIVKKKKVNIKSNKLKTGKTYYVRVKPYYKNKTWGTWKKSKITIA